MQVFHFLRNGKSGYGPEHRAHGQEHNVTPRLSFSRQNGCPTSGGVSYSTDFNDSVMLIFSSLKLMAMLAAMAKSTVMPKANR